ncbi:MAG: chorismate lyase [Pseudomonadales bacterium]|nr:chorismate lyase [Pseudomonadales bacterium]
MQDCTDPSLRWLPIKRLLQSPSAEWKNWLLDPGSLTQRLKQLSANDLKVRVEEQCWYWKTSPTLISCFGKVLCRQAMWSRKVTLIGRGQPWVTAHSLVPVSSLDSSLRRICKLQDKPLGEFLFANPCLSRSQLEITRTRWGWGRRSLFHLHDKPVLVAEFFLPDLLLASQQDG